MSIRFPSFSSILSGVGHALTGDIPGAISSIAAGAASPARAFGNVPQLPGLPAAGPFSGGMEPGISIGGPLGINIGFGQFGQGGVLKPQGGQCPKGYHLNRKPLGASKRHGRIAAHTMCVRNRHVNPLNHRALTRSLRRLKRAGKLVRKIHLAGGTSSRARAVGGHKPGCGCFRCRKR